jgi:para-aminobenzoate synthetase/4-amino-4-deoxychorismate lyase
MKGTIPPGKGHADLLGHDPKNRSENVMIVDLLRNDLGRIAKTGTVKTTKLFEVEKYETLYQMTSTIEAEIPSNINLYDLFKNIFPSGSVTGAPKIRTMQIIRELEKEERNIYCGSIGHITPKKDMLFNVAIRTILLEGEKGELGIGSGIVYDSEPEKEFEECLLKSNFVC